MTSEAPLAGRAYWPFAEDTEDFLAYHEKYSKHCLELQQRYLRGLLHTNSKVLVTKVGSQDATLCVDHPVKLVLATQVVAIVEEQESKRHK